MKNQKKFNNFTYNTKCTIWRISYLNKDKEYNIKNYYSNNYNIVSYNNSNIYPGICINQLNEYYGELCTMYYIWKNNLKSDIVGIDQYRRQWNNIDFDNINKNKIQVFTYWDENRNIFDMFYKNSGLGCFLYSFIMYIKFNYSEYKEKIDYLLYKYNLIQNHINIFICKWEIFDKMCNIIFGYLNNVLPNNQWQNPDKINEYINFNVNFHSKLYLNKNNEYMAIMHNVNRQFIFLFEFIFGTFNNIISESFEYGSETDSRYYVNYTCNDINDYYNILKTYKYDVGNGIYYISVNDVNNIFTNNFNDDPYSYLNMGIYYNDTNNININFNKDIIGSINYRTYLNKIDLNSNEYIYAINSIELNKGNYEIKKI